MRTILVINCGSSTVKFAVFRGSAERCRGLVDRIGIPGSSLSISLPGDRAIALKLPVRTHREGISHLMRLIIAQDVVRSVEEIDAVGHRVVHGGSFTQSTLLDGASIAAIRRSIRLAPLHNPHNLAGILACRKLRRPQVAVFDTAFHAAMPEEAWRYALPERFRDIRRFGFHGISHQYVAREAARILRRPLSQLKLITCHLGNGSSLTAVRNGRSVDNTMGYTPLEGLVMGTRCGSLDPAIPLLIAQRERLSPAEVEKLLNRESGLKALAGTRDMRDILSRAKRGERKARLALNIYCRAVAKHIGAYMALLNGADAIVFTAGIGQNAPEVRRRVLSGFRHQGLRLCPRANPANRAVITRSSSRIAALVIPTDEEREIARETARVLR